MSLLFKGNLRGVSTWKFFFAWWWQEVLYNIWQKKATWGFSVEQENCNSGRKVCVHLRRSLFPADINNADSKGIGNMIHLWNFNLEMEKVFYDSLHTSRRNSYFSLIVKKAHYSSNKWRVFKQKMADSISHYLFLLQKVHSKDSKRIKT